jgi:carboxypeptidase Q
MVRVRPGSLFFCKITFNIPSFITFNILAILSDSMQTYFDFILAENFMLKVILILTFFLSLFSQDLPKDDNVLMQIWDEANNNSQLENLAHELLDEIGPRLVGTPQMDKAGDWAVKKFKEWDLKNARKENYGKWLGWDRGVSHIDLIEPRVRSLEGMILAWSPGTNGKTVEATTSIMPFFDNEDQYENWLKTIKGKIVLVSPLQPTGRPDDNWKEFALEEDFNAMKAERDSLNKKFRESLKNTGIKGSFWTRQGKLGEALEEAGAVAVIASYWSKGWGVNKIFASYTKKIPSIDISLEDYGLVYRLTQNGKMPKLRIKADAKFLGEVPAFNTIAEIKGTEKPDEYVILSAHFDSWDGGSGATDNGTGSVTMMEAIRILKKILPKPKRTILIGLWGSEEQGLNGSSAFVADNPKIVEKVQAVFNQDNGTGRIERVSGSGFLDSYNSIGKWLSMLPQELTNNLKSFDLPGMPSGGGTDHAAFVAVGAPGFNLSSLNWGYWNYTWHTNRDTYDKLVFSELRRNVIMAASLAYLASEDETFTKRIKRTKFPVNKYTDKEREWPEPRKPERKGRLD